MSDAKGLASVKSKITPEAFGAAEEIEKYVMEKFLPALTEATAMADGGVKLGWRDGAKGVSVTIQKDGKLADYTAEGHTNRAAAATKSLLRWLFEPQNT